MTAIDQTLDHNGQSIHRIISAFGAPAFVKAASREELCGEENMPPKLFADVTRRRYPCHTPAATWMSAAFFYEKAGEYNPALREHIAAQIGKSARYFKIAEDVHALADKITKAAEVDESKLPDDVFAIVFTDADGHKERRLPLRNAGEIKAAAAWLVKYRDDLVFDDRHQIAGKILEKAAKFGANVNEQRDALEKMAGLGVCAVKDAVALIRNRVNWLGHTDKPSPLQTELLKLASLLTEKPSRLYHFGPLVKLAQLVDQFDREHSLHTKYDDEFERPEDMLFAITEKVAAELSDELVGNTLTGNYYKKADLQRIPVSQFGDSLGEDFVDAVSAAGAWVDTEKLARIIPTLPLGDAELFDAVVAEAGIPPFATKAAAAIRVPLAAECELASRHVPSTGSLWQRINQH